MKNNYKLKIICLLCLVIAAFSSCKKNELAEEKSLTNNHNNLAGSGRDGKNDLLGYGYNVLGEFANASAATLPVIDVDRLQADQSTRIVYDGSTSNDGRLEAGSDAVSYLKKLTTRFSNTFGADFLGLSLFRATITGSYNNTDSFSSKNIYSSYDFIVQQKRVKLNAQRDILLSYLDPEFLSYIQNHTPEAIVNRYGTHILADIILGGKLNVRYQSETYKSDKTIASSAGVDLHVKKIFNLNTGFTNEANYVLENFNQKLHYTTNGGDPTRNLIGDIVLGNSSNPNPTPTVNIAAWQNSCTVENSVLIDIPANGLLPIYDFIPDQAKALAVKNYIIQYLISNQASLQLEESYNPLKEGLLLQTPNGKVFSVMNGKARHIQDYGTLVAVYNYETVTVTQRPPFRPVTTVVSHIKHVTNLSDEDVTEGNPIPPGAELLRDSRDGKIYFFESVQGKYMLRYITSPEVGNKYYFKLSNARNISNTVGFTIGTPIQ